MIEAVLRIAPAILIDSVAFMLWNLVARSPLAIARDIAGGLRRPAALLRGLPAFIAGLLMFAGAASILTPLLLDAQAFMFLETWTLLTGLLIEALVGPEVRARTLRRRARREAQQAASSGPIS